MNIKALFLHTIQLFQGIFSVCTWKYSIRSPPVCHLTIDGPHICLSLVALPSCLAPSSAISFIVRIPISFLAARFLSLSRGLFWSEPVLTNVCHCWAIKRHDLWSLLLSEFDFVWQGKVYFRAINAAANGKTESSDWRQSEDDRHHRRDQQKAFDAKETFNEWKFIECEWFPVQKVLAIHFDLS